MKFFKIWGNIIRRCWFVFIFFHQGVSWSYRPADLHEMRHECVFLRVAQNARPKFGKIKKPGHDEQKTSWNRSIFQPHSHVHAHCAETVKKLNETTKII